MLVVVKDHAGLILVAFSYRDALVQNDAQGVRPLIVGDLYDCRLQYLSILLVR